MKKCNNLFAALFICPVLLLGVYNLSSAQDFEGVIYYEIPEMAAQGMGEMPYMIKGSRVRMEFGEGAQGGAMIFMPEENKMALVMEAMKGYMTMDLDQSRDVAMNGDKQSDTDDSDEKTDMEKTGKTKTIAGKSCEIWEVNDGENTFQLCSAKGLGTFMMPSNPMAQANTPQWAKEAMAEGFMPLEVIEVSGGKNEVKIRAIKIEEKSLSSSLFEIPKGYNDMSGMLKQMMNRKQN